MFAVKDQYLINTNLFARTLGSLAATALVAVSVPASAAMATQDSAFVNAAAQGGMAEVAAGKLAEERSTNASVKAFAMKMVADHTKANAKLASIAKNKSVMLPDSVGPSNMKMKAALASLHGTAFDSSYMQGQAAGHMKMATLMKQEIASGKDAELVAFAKATLPTVEEHLALAQKDIGSMSKSMSMKPGSKM